MRLKKGCIILIVGVAVVAIFLTFGWEETPANRESRLAEFCARNMERLTTAIFQYAERQGNQKFPPDLDTLVQQSSVKKEELLHCPTDSHPQYHYFAGMQQDMPESLPLLLEPGAPHVYHSSDGRKIRYGVVVYVDGTVRFIAQELLQSTIAQARSAIQIMHTRDVHECLHILETATQHNYTMQAAALWRLRQESEIISFSTVRAYLAALDKVLLEFPSSEEPKAAARQAAYLLWRCDKAAGLPKLRSDLSHTNYLIRKRAWQAIFPVQPLNLPSYTCISVPLPQEVIPLLNEIEKRK
jgi:hypothetical protein